MWPWFVNIANNFLLGSLGGLEPGITVKPTATPLAEASEIVAVVTLVPIVPTVDLVVLRVSFTYSYGRSLDRCFQLGLSSCLFLCISSLHIREYALTNLNIVLFAHRGIWKFLQ